MIRKIIFTLLLLIAVTLVGVPQASANPDIKSNFDTLYPFTVGTRIDSCKVCHIPGLPNNAANLNPYGMNLSSDSAFDPTNATQALINIEPKDSDNDGFSNIDEIHNLTFPGNASDHPVTITPTPTATFNISGFKINNATGNGVQGWNITLMNSTMQTSKLTGADGSYMFTNLANDTYNITEEMQTGWTNISPMSQQVTIAGSDMMNINFTNQPPSVVGAFNISGFKINGTNNSGMGIENWNIMLINPATGMEIANTTTDSTGSYAFTNLSNGTYNVTEGMKAGWTNVSPMSQMATINGTDTMNINFTNTLITPTPITFNISGFKINDTNSNGVWDSGEMGIENWNINLLNATTGTQMANTSTDAQGFYQFMGIAPGSYNVTEEMKDGFIPTNATSSMIAVENMDAMNVNFTNKPVAPSAIVTSFVLTPDLNTTLKGMPISITITALSGNMSQTSFNGTADINITANNMSAVSSPMNVSFTDGNATIQVTSSVAQFVTVTATSVTAANNSANGSTQVMFADKVFSLSKGWNLISIPNFAEPSSVSQLLKNVQNNGVVGFDSSTGNFTTPTDLEPLFGYWINVTADNQSLGFIASTNIPSMPPTRKLFEGWNLIGVSANRSDPDTLNASGLFVDLKRGPDFTQWLYTRLVSFDQPAAAPVTFVAGTDLSDLTALKQGHGYWLFIKNTQSTSTNNVPWAGKQW